MNAKIDSAVGELRGDIKALSARIDGIDKRMDSMEKRMDFMNSFLYYLFVLLAALLILPPVSRWFEARKEAKKSLTLEDVRRLIEENNAKLATMFAPKAA